MALISLVCLLVLSSSALGRSTYGSYSSQSLVKPKVNLAPTSYSYGNTQQLLDVPRTQQFFDVPRAQQFFDVPRAQQFFDVPRTQQLTSSYGSSLSAERSFPPVVQPLAPTLPLSEADIACKGQRPDTVLPLGQGEKYIVCTDDSKGDEISCPKDLLWSAQTRRCERRISLNENVCASQPCLNGGQCYKTEYSYQCQCAPGFTGKTCELDATVCQTQQPCGQASDSFCQSFHVGAALSHVCILRDGLAYGVSAQQTHPNPCQGVLGPHPLAFSNKGFLMCDGDQMFIQSCPGGTLWDDVNKACVWPDMFGVVSISAADQSSQQTYGQNTYGSQVEIQRPSLNQIELPRVSSYGQQVEIQRPSLNQIELPRVSSYGHQAHIQRPSLSQDELPRVSSYGQQVEVQRPSFNQMELPRVSSYGQQVEVQRPSFNQVEVPRVSSYGQKLDFQRPSLTQMEAPRSFAPVMHKSSGY